MANERRFKVTVTELKTETVMGKQEWTKIGEELVVEGSEKLKAIYGHTPPIEVVETKEVQIYEQTVSELDMAALVTVVNKIGEGNPQPR